MNQSIYTECVNLSPDHVAWLDGCGAKWGSGDRLSELKSYTRVEFMCVDDTWYFMSTHNNSFTHIPTGFEFCERVAEILGIEKPVFGDKFIKAFEPNEEEINKGIDKAEKEWQAKDKVGEDLKKFGIPIQPTHPHRAYRVLSSLDGIPFDTRIPLSEWIPPIGERVCFIYDGGLFYAAEVNAIVGQGLMLTLDNGVHRSDAVNTDGHWMRIV